MISYANGNVVSDGSTIVTLASGQMHTFSGLDEHSVITATGPIDASYDADAKDALVPEGYASDVMSFPRGGTTSVSGSDHPTAQRSSKRWPTEPSLRASPLAPAPGR
ncbi:MAG: hypothetical protein R2706_04585 [Acidimicrobiales bacterium]